jgi:hypothetical protein
MLRRAFVAEKSGLLAVFDNLAAGLDGRAHTDGRFRDDA